MMDNYLRAYQFHYDTVRPVRTENKLEQYYNALGELL